jgi:hypothetical protein
VLLLLRDLAIAAADALMGRQRRRYEHWVDIKAPRPLVWSMLSAPDITFEGAIPIRIVTEAVAGRPGVLRMRIMTGDMSAVMLVRVADERAERAVLYELLPHGTDAVLLDGEDDYLGYVADDVPGGTRLTMTRELTVTSRFGRLTVPLGLRAGAKRLKHKCEVAATLAAGVEPS